MASVALSYKNRADLFFKELNARRLSSKWNKEGDQAEAEALLMAKDSHAF